MSPSGRLKDTFSLAYFILWHLIKRLNTELRSVAGETSSQSDTEAQTPSWRHTRSPTAVTKATPFHCMAPSTVLERPCLSDRPCVYQALPIFKSGWTLLCGLKCYHFLDLSSEQTARLPACSGKWILIR